MSEARISYFSLQGLQGKEAKLDWIAGTRFEEIPFENISPDGKGNWINLTDNDFDSFLPLVDKEVKAGKSERAVFKLFSRGLETGRDEWVYDLSISNLALKMSYLVRIYSERLQKSERPRLDIKWDRELEKDLSRSIHKSFEPGKIRDSLYRPFTREYVYFDENFNRMPGQLFKIFPKSESENQLITITNHVQIPFL